MKKLVVLVIVLLIVTFAVRISEAAMPNADMAALDPHTFVMTDGRVIYLFGIEDGKLILKDSVFVYSFPDRTPAMIDTDKTILKRLRLEKK